MAVHKAASASSVLGGENSNETCNGPGSVIRLAKLMGWGSYPVSCRSCGFFFCFGACQPKLDGEFFARPLRRNGLDAGVHQPGRREPAFHFPVRETQAAMGEFFAQIF